ncbi:zinc-finger protein [Asimina triloba]
MENGGGKQRWNLRPSAKLASPSQITIRAILDTVMSNIDGLDGRRSIPLGHGDPTAFPCFRTASVAEDAVISAVRSSNYNCYSPSVGTLPARKAIAEYLSHDLPRKVFPEDVFVTLGCIQAIEITMAVLAYPGANILLPRPGFPLYEARAAFCGIEIRHFDLLPDRGWEVDLDAVENLADENTVGIVIINPGNPCGSVFSYQHLAKIAETAKKLGTIVIADEVYGHLTFGNNPFVPMGTFKSVVPVLTLGSISKRWIVPGWRLGWLVANDSHGVLKEAKIIDSIINYLNVCSDPVTFIQGAVPEILRKTGDDFFDSTIGILKQTADICFSQLKEISCLACPHKPEGSMFAMVKLNLSHLEAIYDDVDFCCKLAKEESVIILPGCAVGLKNWLRITFATDPASLEEGLGRLKSFCKRHMKK